jgi:CubicO group peptidase (beta-lactamase class C family)
MWNEDIVAYLAKTGLPSALAGGTGFLAAPLICDPGDRWEYGISTDWLGRLVERISGVNLDEYFRRNILDPLEMADTYFELPTEKVGRLVKVLQRQQDSSLTELDYPAPAPNGFYGGGGGLVSTAGDYLRFVRMLLHDGVLDGARILASETVALMGENHLGALPIPVMKTTNPMLSRDVDFFPGVNKTWGLGFLINTEALAEGRAAGSLCWAGFYNTYYWIDRETGVGAVLLTQLLPFYDDKVIALLHEYERALYSCVRSE